MRRPKLERVLDLSEVADLIQCEQRTRKARRQYVMRLFRRFEAADREPYLRPLGRGLGVPLSAVERAFRWDPGTIAALRDQVSGIDAEVRTLKRRHGYRLRELERTKEDHERRIQKHEEWQKLTQNYLASSAALHAS